MTFANPLPWWGIPAAAAACALVAWQAYRRLPLTPRQRIVASLLRAGALAWLVVCLMRPLAAARSADAAAIVPVLVDVSRSMALPAADGQPRIDDARRLAQEVLQPSIAPGLRREVLAFGDRVSSADPTRLTASDAHTRIGDALASVRDRYRGEPVPGIILLSDGADNGDVDAERLAEDGPPIYAVAVGPHASPRDREVLGVTAADAVLDGASVDVTATAVAHGYGTAPIRLRLLEDGRAVDVRSVTPASDGAPVSTVFTVAPKRDAATVYTVETPPAPDELVLENNARSAIVPLPRPPLRVLLVQGAPGFEHAFLRRAWTTDRAIQIDSVMRKGMDDRGTDTFYVQAAPGRAEQLLGGLPSTREALFAYDVIVLANVEADALTPAATELMRAFVSERGGGLLVLGARGFQRQGFRGTALENVLPLEVTDRESAAVAVSSGAPVRNRVTLTPAGAAHPIMQIGDSLDETQKRWAAVPALAAVSPLGSARPGSTVLALTAGPGGDARPLIAVQRVGDGRVMVFTGEASWRWRMMLPAADRTFDRFWRQAVRWLGLRAPAPVQLTLPSAAAPGAAPVDVVARDAAFVPQRDAAVDVRIESPDGKSTTVRAAPVADAPGRFRATLRPTAPGLYRVAATARRGTNVLGSAAGSLLVGGVDPELTDPRVDVGTLSRITRASGGAVVDATEIAAVMDRLRSRPAAALVRHEDLWGRPWSFALLASLLMAEWLLRRRWGLR
ncbi:MAG TPA: glutamine amidotransferase [Vicinamibacterales bacterium]|nr:glutamine amidotransferase [Vicinamibacterales bacterium]